MKDVRRVFIGEETEDPCGLFIECFIPFTGDGTHVLVPREEWERLRGFAIDLSTWVWGEFENDEDRPKLTPLLERAESMNLFVDDVEEIVK